MVVEKVILNNFRNYENQEITFDNGINIIYGKNAQGKTNLVESIYYASIGKSFKIAKDKELINFKHDSARIKLTVKKEIGNVDIEINLFQNKKKQIKVNGGYLTRIGDLLGNLVTVFFCPNDLKLIKDAPGDRRKFLDVSISQLSRKYFYLLLKYQEILEQRNNLLKNKNNLEIITSQIDVWDRYLAKIAKDIILQRVRFVEILSVYANKVHKYLTMNQEELTITYQGIMGSEEELEDLIYQKLKLNFEKDLQAGYTQIGPHRDDLKLVLNDTNVKLYGSQGQQRTVALSLKLAEKEILKEKLGEYPITILDDVFSELDDDR
ncbi:MAG: DNA replication/repair protein RecF, partial [Clostridia bacterium]|nr:DNA replication/repair protein RecF [Clostridia bacterium]